jgi:hypothetical protein
LFQTRKLYIDDNRVTPYPPSVHRRLAGSYKPRQLSTMATGSAVEWPPPPGAGCRLGLHPPYRYYDTAPHSALHSLTFRLELALQRGEGRLEPVDLLALWRHACSPTADCLLGGMGHSRPSSVRRPRPPLPSAFLPEIHSLHPLLTVRAMLDLSSQVFVCHNVSF